LNSGDRLYCVVYGNLYRSTDDGESWTKLNPPSYPDRLFIDGKGRICETSYNFIYVSNDGGDSWLACLRRKFPNMISPRNSAGISS